MNKLRISLVATAIFLLSGLGMASAQVVSYYYHPKNGQKSVQFKPYVDTSARSKPVKFEVVMVGRPVDSLLALPALEAPAQPVAPSTSSADSIATPAVQPAKPIETEHK